MQIRFRLPTSICVAVLATIGLAACGGSTIDRSKLESDLAAQLGDDDAALRDVRCQEVDAEVGAPIRCTGFDAQSTKFFIEGEITEGDGDDDFAFKATIVQAEVKGTTVAAEAKASLEAEVGEKTEAMICPETVEVPTKKPVHCTLTVPGGDRHRVTVSYDEKGEMSAEADTEPLP